MASMANKQSYKIPLLITSLLSLLILYLFNGTGQEADSYHHHLIAKLAPIHPELYLYHWGKPLYTLVSSPFAQFGFIGSKIFNIACSLFSMYLAYLILRKLKVQLAVWVIPIFFIIPLNFQISFSAFTEPFFATALLLGIYFTLNKQFHLSAFIISFLPMIRSEGLLFIALFAFYFILKKEFRSILLLLSGHLIYSIIGVIFFSKSFLWLFTEIPYANLDSPYGEGKALHFVEQLFYVLGPILTILFVISLLTVTYRSIKNDREVGILILFGFLIFFLFHSISWYLGWFNSMGLKRVFGAITPLMAMIIVIGLEPNIGRLRNDKLKFTLMLLICIGSAGLLFSKGPAGIRWNKEMNLSSAQVLADEVTEYIIKNNISYDRLIFADRYLAKGFELDVFDTKHFHILNEDGLRNLNEGDLIIWDNWHAPVDFGITEDQLSNISTLKRLKEFNVEEKNRTIHYIVLRFSEESVKH